MFKRIAVIFGAIFVFVGVIGFVPGITLYTPGSDHGLLLRAFAVDPAHNVVHILTGVIAVGVGLMTEAASRWYFKVFGILYAITALLGFGYGAAPLFGVMANNLPDAVLHAAIAFIALYLGFGHLPTHLGHPMDEGTHHPA